MSANESELMTSEHVRVPEWTGHDVVKHASRHALTTEEIDEILNGQAELHDREKVKPTYQNLYQRFSIVDTERFEKKMNTFNSDINRYTPPDAVERDIDRPLQLEHWTDEENSYNLEKDERLRHHYIGFIPGLEAEQGLVFHYEWTEEK